MRKLFLATALLLAAMVSSVPASAQFGCDCCTLCETCPVLGQGKAKGSQVQIGWNGWESEGCQDGWCTTCWGQGFASAGDRGP